MKLSCGEAVCDVRLERDAVRLDDRRLELRFLGNEAGTLDVWIDGVRHRVACLRQGGRLLVWCEGRTYTMDQAAARTSKTGEHANLAAPMPGRVRQTLVREGDAVEKGQVVLILEAMKMEHAIRAPEAGKVVRLVHRDGDLVDAGAELAVIQ